MVGNRKSKKYHVPSGRYYADAKDGRTAVFFATKDVAKKAEYEKSTR